jgi:hypothetical protein
VAKPYAGTDTDSTPEHRAVGGLGKYSHGVFHLVHQHWPQQLEIAGGFNVHNTEASEGFHKECMVLPCRRVRHYSTRNRTFDGMQKYLQRDLLFNNLVVDIGGSEFPPDNQYSYRARVKELGKPLRWRQSGNPVVMVCPEGVQTQANIMHCDVRVGWVELLDLMCMQFQIPLTRRSYARLGGLQWAFDQRMKMTDGSVYWATDSDYLHSANSRRRDIFLMKQCESVKVRLPCGQVVERQTAMCCQAMVFVTVRNIHSVFGRDAPSGITGDSYTFVLVRWFQAHPDATERNDRNLPLCPAPFNINHALWQYAVADKFRSLIFDGVHDRPTKHFEDSRFMFGDTTAEQLQSLHAEKRAYYGLIKPCNIDSIACMCKEFELNTTRQSSTWLHTINMM